MHLSPWRKEKGATAMKQKWCHGNIPVIRQLIERPVQTKMWMTYAKEGGVIPNSGFARDDGMAKEGHRKDNSITVQNSSISYNQACIRSRAVISGLYLRSVHFGRNEFVEGSSRSRVVGEVVVHVS